MMIDLAQTTPLVLFILGLFGAGHCVGMCGGIVTALGLSSQGKHAPLLVLGYNFARIVSYSLAGLLVGFVGYWGSSYLSFGPWLRIIAGLLLILMGLYLANWWHVITVLEKFGTKIWKKIQPLSANFLPPRTFYQSFMVGLIWGWLPCGLVYSALALAATANTPFEGALLMAAFGLGTAPAMVAGGFFSERAASLLQNKLLRTILGICVIFFGLWTIQFNVQNLIGKAHNHSSMLHE